RRVSTSASAIMISAATQAAEPVIWCAMLNRAIAGPAPLVAAMAKTILAPTPAIHRLAASHPARPRARPALGGAAGSRLAGLRRSLVVSPATAPIVAPAATQASSRMMSLPPPGTECRNRTAAAPTARTGPASERRSSGCSRIWRMTMSTRTALITYMVVLFMPPACPATGWPGVGPRVGLRVDNLVSPRVDQAPLSRCPALPRSRERRVRAEPGQACLQPGHPHPQRPAGPPGRTVEQEPLRVDGLATDHQVVHPVIDVT